MKRKYGRFLLSSVLSFVLFCTTVSLLAAEAPPERFPIEPENYYCLTFEVASPSASGSDVR